MQCNLIINEEMLKEYKAEMERHNQAVKDIFNKYNPPFGCDEDKR